MNTLTFQQISTILQSVQEQATGQKALAATNTAEFVTAADTTLRTGYDPVLNAIGQVLSRTIFSVRPYYAKFRGLQYDATEWGNHVRKLNIADTPMSDDERYSWPVGYNASKDVPTGNGESVDMYVLNKPVVVQTNFYGASVFQDYFPIFRDQLTNAFRGPDEFQSFIGMVMQNAQDKREQRLENYARATLVNFIAGILAENTATTGGTDRVIHLLSEYNTATGLKLTATTVYQPDNYRAFVQWMYSRVAGICAMMTERSLKFQTVINSQPIMRHTPYEMQQVYIFAPARYQMETMALADIYHDTFMRLAYNETVNFWQSINAPDQINVTPTYIGASGTPVTPTAPVAQSNVFGVIFDREACGYAALQEWMMPTPFNAAGGYTNYWYHVTPKNFNDHTEKGVVLLLD